MEENNKFDFLKLKYYVKAKYPLQETLADELGITLTSLSNKLNNRSPFNYEEVYKLINLLEIPKDEIYDVFFNTIS